MVILLNLVREPVGVGEGGRGHKPSCGGVSSRGVQGGRGGESFYVQNVLIERKTNKLMNVTSLRD